MRLPVKALASGVVLALLAPDPAASFHSWSRRQLRNGLTIAAAERPGTDAVAITLLVKGGSTDDPPERNGLAFFTAQLLGAGTKKRSGDEIAESIARLGGNLRHAVKFDFTTIRWTGLKQDLGSALALMADMIRDPVFPVDEFAEEKAWMVADLERHRETAETAILRHFFGSGPYGSAAPGDALSIGRISRDDVVRFHGSAYRPDETILAAAGGLKLDDFFALAEDLFADWEVEERDDAPSRSLRVDREGRILLVDRPGSSAEIRLAFVGAPAGSPDLPALEVAAGVLAGGPESRLGRKLREDNGWVYELWADVSPFARTGLVSVGMKVSHELLDGVLQAALEELRSLRSTPLSEAAVRSAKKEIVSRLYFDADRIEEAAEDLAVHHAYHPEGGSPEEFVSAIRSVTAEDVRRVAVEYLDAGKAALAVEGDARAIERSVPALIRGKWAAASGGEGRERGGFR